MAQIIRRILILLLCGVSVSASAAQVHVLIDQAGYETNAPKQALIQVQGAEQVRHFMLVNWKTGATGLRGDLRPVGEVDHWDTGHYWLAESL
jgi:Cellulase N-terminal ig-like domain